MSWVVAGKNKNTPYFGKLYLRRTRRAAVLLRAPVGSAGREYNKLSFLYFVTARIIFLVRPGESRSSEPKCSYRGGWV